MFPSIIWWINFRGSILFWSSLHLATPAGRGLSIILIFLFVIIFFIINYNYYILKAFPKFLRYEIYIKKNHFFSLSNETNHKIIWRYDVFHFFFLIFFKSYSWCSYDSELKAITFSYRAESRREADGQTVRLCVFYSCRSKFYLVKIFKKMRYPPYCVKYGLLRILFLVLFFYF